MLRSPGAESKSVEVCSLPLASLDRCNFRINRLNTSHGHEVSIDLRIRPTVIPHEWTPAGGMAEACHDRPQTSSSSPDTRRVETSRQYTCSRVPSVSLATVRVLAQRRGKAHLLPRLGLFERRFKSRGDSKRENKTQQRESQADINGLSGLFGICRGSTLQHLRQFRQSLWCDGPCHSDRRPRAKYMLTNQFMPIPDNCHLCARPGRAC